MTEAPAGVNHGGVLVNRVVTGADREQNHCAGRSRQSGASLPLAFRQFGGPQMITVGAVVR